MVGLNPNDMLSLWNRRLDVLKIRRPGWILRALFGPLILLLVLLLTLRFERFSLMRAAIVYIPYVATSLALYIWVKGIPSGEKWDARDRRTAASIYGVFDINSLTLISVSTLLIGLLLLSSSGSSPWLVSWVGTLALGIYLAAAVATLLFIRPLLVQRAQSHTPMWHGTSKWLLVLPNLLIGLSIATGIFLSRGEGYRAGDLFWAAVAFASALSIVPIAIRGFFEVLVLLLSGLDYDST